MSVTLTVCKGQTNSSSMLLVLLNCSMTEVSWSTPRPSRLLLGHSQPRLSIKSTAIWSRIPEIIVNWAIGRSVSVADHIRPGGCSLQMHSPTVPKWSWAWWFDGADKIELELSTPLLRDGRDKITDAGLERSHWGIEIGEWYWIREEWGKRSIAACWRGWWWWCIRMVNFSKLGSKRAITPFSWNKWKANVREVESLQHLLRSS